LSKSQENKEKNKKKRINKKYLCWEGDKGENETAFAQSTKNFRHFTQLTL